MLFLNFLFEFLAALAVLAEALIFTLLPLVLLVPVLFKVFVLMFFSVLALFKEFVLKFLLAMVVFVLLFVFLVLYFVPVLIAVTLPRSPLWLRLFSLLPLSLCWAMGPGRPRANLQPVRVTTTT